MLVAAALSACSPRSPTAAENSSAITNGSDDDGDPGVVALLQDTTLICTATLIAPRLLLTAAHCLPDGAMPTAHFGSAPGDGGAEVAIAAVRRHPAFDAATLANDLAMALLADDAPAGVTPSPLPPAPLDDGAIGATLRLVGFGRTAADDTAAPRKRAGTATLATLEASELTFTPAPSQTCAGDSGGPAFATVGGVAAIVGVTSSGDAACAASGRDLRVDAYAAAFIAPFVAATSAGAAGPGDRCWYAANCAPGAGDCLPALDDPTVSFCTPPCDGSACPGVLECLAGGDGRALCRQAAPSPGAPSSRCSDDNDCARGVCVAKSGSAARVCAETCFPDLPGFCSAGFACAPVAGSDQSACFAKTVGGCAFAAAPAPAPLGAILLVLLGALVSRWR